MSPGRLRIGAALVLLAPFVPMLFQGEEWGASTPFQYFTDHRDPDLGRAVSEGRRREFQAFGWDPEQVPDPQDPATFERSRLDWSEPARGDHAALLAWHLDLIALRRTHPDLAGGDRSALETDFDEEAGWLTLRRGAVAVAVNLGVPREVPLARPGSVVLAHGGGVEVRPSGVFLPTDGVAVLVQG